MKVPPCLSQEAAEKERRGKEEVTEPRHSRASRSRHGRMMVDSPVMHTSASTPDMLHDKSILNVAFTMPRISHCMNYGGAAPNHGEANKSRSVNTSQRAGAVVNPKLSSLSWTVRKIHDLNVIFYGFIHF